MAINRSPSTGPSHQPTASTHSTGVSPLPRCKPCGYPPPCTPAAQSCSGARECAAPRVPRPCNGAWPFQPHSAVALLERGRRGEGAQVEIRTHSSPAWQSAPLRGSQHPMRGSQRPCTAVRDVRGPDAPMTPRLLCASPLVGSWAMDNFRHCTTRKMGGAAVSSKQAPMRRPHRDATHPLCQQDVAQ